MSDEEGAWGPVPIDSFENDSAEQAVVLRAMIVAFAVLTCTCLTLFLFAKVTVISLPDPAKRQEPIRITSSRYIPTAPPIPDSLIHSLDNIYDFPYISIGSYLPFTLPGFLQSAYEKWIKPVVGLFKRETFIPSAKTATTITLVSVLIFMSLLSFRLFLIYRYTWTPTVMITRDFQQLLEGVTVASLIAAGLFILTVAVSLALCLNNLPSQEYSFIAVALTSTLTMMLCTCMMALALTQSLFSYTSVQAFILQNPHSMLPLLRILSEHSESGIAALSQAAFACWLTIFLTEVVLTRAKGCWAESIAYGIALPAIILQRIVSKQIRYKYRLIMLALFLKLLLTGGILIRKFVGLKIMGAAS